jgi:hypothetical protein
MNKEQALVAFEQHSIRRFSDEANETLDFPVIDVVVAGKTGGGVAGKARWDLENMTGTNVVTGENFLPPGHPKKSLPE